MPIPLKESKKIKNLHWLCCPNCGAKTNIGIYPQTTLVFFPLYCPECKTKTLISGTNCFMMLNEDVHSAYMKTRKPVEEISWKPESTKTDYGFLFFNRVVTYS